MNDWSANTIIAVLGAVTVLIGALATNIVIVINAARDVTHIKASTDAVRATVAPLPAQIKEIELQTNSHLLRLEQRGEALTLALAEAVQEIADLKLLAASIRQQQVPGESQP